MATRWRVIASGTVVADGGSVATCERIRVSSDVARVCLTGVLRRGGCACPRRGSRNARIGGRTSDRRDSIGRRQLQADYQLHCQQHKQRELRAVNFGPVASHE